MMNRNIAAWTGLDASFPPFVSINADPSRPGIVAITVREGGQRGATAHTEMTSREFYDLLRDATGNWMRFNNPHLDMTLPEPK